MPKFLLIITSLILLQCSSNETIPNNSFYYWKSDFAFSKEEKHLADSLNVNSFYVRFFDVEWSAIRGEAVPIGECRFQYAENFPEKIVPCIYIENEVMLKSRRTQLDTLAQRMREKILLKIKGHEEYRANIKEWSDTTIVVLLNWHEIQVDCDWTESSKDNYFYFLTKVKGKFSAKQLSTTLRLWQLKYQKKAGIPPVDKVMLMCYSTGDPKAYNINNSIATYDEVTKYIQGQSYPLACDIALPIYHWAVLFRQGKFKGILRSMDVQKLSADTTQYLHLGDNRYAFKSDTVIGNHYLRYGDELRLESIPAEDMPKLISLLKKEKLLTEESTLSFFAWDTAYINNYGTENIKSYYNRID